METPYVFNVTLVNTNATGAHFAGFIKNNRSGDVYKLGEIFTASEISALVAVGLAVGLAVMRE